MLLLSQKAKLFEYLDSWAPLARSIGSSIPKQLFQFLIQPALDVLLLSDAKLPIVKQEIYLLLA